ncbi:MAG TPA: zinc metalloprotease HtpX [Blastococcus sp.]|jgi:heat shock protein HtpX|nr:zinc metalloprotease HtpX [Blastococcus sp.]
MPDTTTQRRHQVRNVVQSALLLGCLPVLAAGLAWLLFGAQGLAWILVPGVVVLVFRPRVPARAVLAVYRARPLPYAVAPELHWMVQELAERAGLHSVPALYYVPSPVPNCFCVGQGREAALAVTDGMLRRLTRRELAGALAHEVGHLRAGDTTVMSLSDAVSRLAQALSYIGMVGCLVGLPVAFRGDPRLLLLSVVLVITPLVVTLLQVALSRSREFDADLAAARLTGDPEGLASALEVLEWSNGRIWERILVGRGPVPDPLIVRTHPSTTERTSRLRELEVADRWHVVGRPVPPVGYPHVHGPARLRFPGVRW